MAVIKKCGLSQYMLHWFIINLGCWLGWLSGVAFGQVGVSETLTSFVTFPSLGIACLGNLAVFFINVVRGRLEQEIGAKDAMFEWPGLLPEMQRVQRLPLENRTTCPYENELVNLERCSVIMVSTKFLSNSMDPFMYHMFRVHDLQSVFLQCVPQRLMVNLLQGAGRCFCGCDPESCGCLVFNSLVDITMLLARTIPGTVKIIGASGYRCLLPSFKCLRNGCHGTNNGMLYVEGERLREGPRLVSREAHAAVCDILDWVTVLSIQGSACICIPILHPEHPERNDDWTKQLIRFFKRPRTTSTSLALEKYIDRDGKCSAIEEYDNLRFFVLPRAVEIIINIGLTFWFKVDGFSSALVARRALKGHIVDNKVSEFYAHVFLTQAIVKSNATNTNVSQALFFRDNLLTPTSLYNLIAFVNLACAISWTVLVALEGSANKWYLTHSLPPSKVRDWVIIASIFGALILDCIDLNFYRRFGGLSHFKRKVLMILAIIVLEVFCIGSGIAVLVSGKLKFGRWIYSVLQVLVWIKWGMGTYLLEHYLSIEEIPPWSGSGGLYMYSSAYWLNAILAGVRAEWEYSGEKSVSAG